MLIATNDGNRFVVGESDFDFFDNHACRCESGAILFCLAGRARVAINQYQGRIRRHTIMLVLPGSMLLFNDRTADFRMVFCAFSSELFSEAGFRLDPAFFRVLQENPIAYPPPPFVEGIMYWFRMVESSFRDRDNRFRDTIMKNRLQNALLEVYDKLKRFEVQLRRPNESTNRQTELFHRFVAAVNEYASREREVAYYADLLCISTRYLSTIVRTVAHCSAKEIIDRAVVLEIRMLLQSTDLSVQEIAYRMHFPDQSYLGRYFKKHTGQSPSEFRNAQG